MRNFKDRKFQNEKGQLTIFLGVVLMVTITMMAFVINVGLFVKAKINLQNAVDAAAWSGASVQARQLTKIAYLNWEMRNTYKEYMFKYYVLGVLGLRDQLDPPNSSTGVNFRLEPFFDSTNPEAASLGTEAIDPHNIPSVCIHFGSENNICKIYDVPGIPRFNTVGLPSITPMQESFLNTIVEVKSANCSKRSDINFGVAMVWAFGTGANVFKDIPQIAAQRVGAWPQAFELAMRIRNMEFMMNTPPVDQPICRQGAGCLQVDQLNAEQLAFTDPPFPKNERSVKAFMSAYRNLGGGKFKESGAGNSNQNPFSQTFKLTELKPQKNTIDRASLSGFLINPSAYGGVIDKYYVDLKAWPVNLTTFYTTFVPTNSNVAGVAAEGTCKGSKTALPVPAYLTGFTKNPEIITYYAVKGEANFVGMLYPFADDEGVVLSAYSAAKPFGGRVGPKLFNSTNNQTVVARTDTISRKSGPYISTMVIPASSSFDSGKVIPFSADYFAQNGDPVGGIPGTGTEVKFVVPNLLYTNVNMSAQSAGDIQELTDANGNRSKLNSPDELLGLYDIAQYTAFIGNLETVASDAVMSNEQIARSIASVRAPTPYEAANYLIPSVPKYDNGDVFSNSHPSQISAGGATVVDEYRLFAPLVGTGTLYPTDAEAITVINEFLDDNEESIKSYLTSLHEVAQSMRTAATSTRGGGAAYNDAANTIHNNPSTPDSAPLPGDCLNISVAQKFHHFFREDSTQCDIIPLKEMMREYINGASAGSASEFKNFYRTSYQNNMGTNQAIMSAYSPDELYAGKSGSNKRASLLQGTEEDDLVLRNFYSTKFVGVNSIRIGGNGYLNSSDAKSIFSEQNIFSSNSSDVYPNASPVTGGNPLETDLIDEFKRGGEFDY